MSRETREVTTCDGCGTHDGVSDWPQIGGDWCDECADDQFTNHHCKVCSGFDINTGPLRNYDGKNTCENCVEDIELDAATERHDLLEMKRSASGPYPWWSECYCGWLSDDASTEKVARKSHEEHREEETS